MPVNTSSPRVEWQSRPGGRTAWVSVGDPDKGPHFQCDYIGDMVTGPKSVNDFACRPPGWVISGLGLLG